jgi:phosphatidylserine/phosphatidylglycerophosphate/cardiolipin synthase-like enzyme
MWSTQVAKLFADTLRRNRDLHLVVVVPRYPDVDGRLALPPNQVGRAEAIALCQQAGRGRVHVYDVENHASTPVYVHAKVCIVDDIWASVGSDNFNRRSWTHDSELSCSVLDSTLDERLPKDPTGDGDRARTFARDLRLTLWREHLDRALDGSQDDDLLDPESAVAAISASAEAMEKWHRRGRAGTRPPGRLRPHQPEKLGLRTRLWAVPIYRMVYDPDGRSWRDKLRRRW